MLFFNAAQMLGDIAAQDDDNALRRRLKYNVDAALSVDATHAIADQVEVRLRHRFQVTDSVIHIKPE